MTIMSSIRENPLFFRDMFFFIIHTSLKVTYIIYLISNSDHFLMKKLVYAVILYINMNVRDLRRTETGAL